MYLFINIITILQHINKLLCPIHFKNKTDVKSPANLILKSLFNQKSSTIIYWQFINDTCEEYTIKDSKT